MNEIILSSVITEVVVDNVVVMQSYIGGNAADFFQTLNKFSELDTEQKKADARTNLGVQVFDCGEFF